MPTDELKMFVIYEKPKDHPSSYVVREWTIKKSPIPLKPTYLFMNLEAARAWIEEKRPGLYKLNRHSDDDPVIVESWI